MSHLQGSQYFIPTAVTVLCLQSWQRGSSFGFTSGFTSGLVNTLKVPSGWRIRIGILQEDTDPLPSIFLRQLLCLLDEIVDAIKLCIYRGLLVEVQVRLLCFQLVVIRFENIDSTTEKRGVEAAILEKELHLSPQGDRISL